MSKGAVLALAENDQMEGVCARWIDHLVSFGLRTARYSENLGEGQFVLALSVPQRDYAAVLIACGWVLGTQRSNMPEPREFLEKAQPGQKIRMVAKKQIVAANYFGVETRINGDVIVTNEGTWHIDSIAAIAAMSEDMMPAEFPSSQKRPEPGSLASMAGIDSHWDSWLASPPADLALIGTRNWLESELGACISKPKNSSSVNNRIENVLLPKRKRVVAWNAHIVSYADREACLSLPKRICAVILDGNGAIKFLPDIQSKVVICVLDRSTATESAEEFIVQYKNARGIRLSLETSLRMQMPQGFECMGFMVNV